MHESRLTAPVQPRPEIEAQISAELRALTTAHYGPGMNQEEVALNARYTDNHNAYLGNVVQRVEASGKSITVDRATGPHEFTLQSYQDDRRRILTAPEMPPLDVELLGLPAIPQDHEVPRRVLGLAVRQKPDGAVTAVTAVLRADDGKVESLYLENLSAAADPTTDTPPQWKQPGKIQLSHPIDATGETAINGKAGKGVMRLNLNPREGGSRDTVSFIHATTTGAERQVKKARAEGADGYRRRRRRRIASAVVGLAATLAPTYHPHHATEIKSGAAMVQYDKNDPLPEAVANYLDPNTHLPDATVGRAEAAFNAYFSGDKAGLKQQAESLGYNANWINAKAMEAVEGATNARDLETAFNTATSGTQIRLQVANTQGRLQVLAPFKDVAEAPATDFALTKQVATNMLDVLNTFDRANLNDQFGPVEVVVTGRIHGVDQQTVGNGEADGFCSIDSATGNTVIALAATGESNAEEQTTAGHELTHGEDQVSDRALSWEIEGLNPEEFSYDVSRGSASSDAPIAVNSNQVTGDTYAGSEGYEDTAVTGSYEDVPNPTIDVTKSTFQQKELAYMLYQEDKQPGFIANLLSRARSVEKPGIGNTVAGAWNAARLPMRLGGILTLLANAALLNRNRLVERQRKRYDTDSK